MNRGNTNTTSTLSFIGLYQQIQIGHADTTLTLGIIRLNQQIQITNKEVQIQHATCNMLQMQRSIHECAAEVRKVQIQ